MLEEKGLVYGVNKVIPSAWVDHIWQGRGCPCETLVLRLILAITAGQVLPKSECLQRWPVLEASALKAMDLLSTLRLAAIFHADDPIIPASSAGALQQAVSMLSNWSYEHRASFHIGENKTVVMPIISDVGLPELRHTKIELRMHSGPKQGLHQSSFSLVSRIAF